MLPLAFEEAALHAIQAAQSQPLDWLMLAVTLLGNPLFWVLVCCGMLWWGKDRDAFFLMNLVVFSAAVVAVAKPLFGKLRPAAEKFRILAVDTYGGFSLPSGHATLVGAVYAFLSREFERFKWPLLVVALLVAYSRMYLGAHFVLDVVAGLALGYVIGVAAFEVRKRLEHAHFKITKIEEEGTALAVVLVALAVFAFFEPPALSAVVFGWYAGFFVLKEQDVEVHVLELGKNLKMLAFGFASLFVFLLLAGTAANLGAEAEIAVLFFLGAWASYGFPALYERVRRHGLA